MITFESVSKTIGRRPIIEDVSFAVPDGRVTGFVGPNGAGKSTSMRVALGLTSAQHGQALFDGRDYRSLRLPLREVGSLLPALVGAITLVAISFPTVNDAASQASPTEAIIAFLLFALMGGAIVGGVVYAIRC